MIKFIDLNPFSLIFKPPVFLFSYGLEVAEVREKSLAVLFITLYTFLLIFMDKKYI